MPTVEGIAVDTLLAAYLIEPGLPGGYALADVAQRFLGIALEEHAPKKGEGEAGGARSGRRRRRSRRARGRGRPCLGPVLDERLASRGMWELAVELEFPLIGVLARMEHAGILVDRGVPRGAERRPRLPDARLESARSTSTRARSSTSNSTPQLQRILFEQLELPKTKKIKTGYSTDQAELAKIRDAHPIVEELLEYREVAKLKTGFTDALLPLIDPKTGRIHTTYLQASASTGRLASTNPNMQNIPIRGELGRQIRRAFIAPEGHVLDLGGLLADRAARARAPVRRRRVPRSLRVRARLPRRDRGEGLRRRCGGRAVADARLREAVLVRHRVRHVARSASRSGSASTTEEAQEFIDAYYAQFPKVRDFLDEQVDAGEGRRLHDDDVRPPPYISELDSGNYRMRAMGERMALNAPIQGSAADIIKRAMIDVDARCSSRARARPDAALGPRRARLRGSGRTVDEARRSSKR